MLRELRDGVRRNGLSAIIPFCRNAKTRLAFGSRLNGRPPRHPTRKFVYGDLAGLFRHQLRGGAGAGGMAPVPPRRMASTSSASSSAPPASPLNPSTLPPSGPSAGCSSSPGFSPSFTSTAPSIIADSPGAFSCCRWCSACSASAPFSGREPISCRCRTTTASGASSMRPAAAGRRRRLRRLLRQPHVPRSAPGSCGPKRCPATASACPASNALNR